MADTPEAPALRLKRLAMRSQRRGIREMDLILGSFAAAALPAMDNAALDLYEVLLEENDHDLYAWISTRPDRGGDGPAPLRPLLDRIAAHARAGAMGAGAAPPGPAPGDPT